MSGGGRNVCGIKRSGAERKLEYSLSASWMRDLKSMHRAGSLSSVLKWWPVEIIQC